MSDLGPNADASHNPAGDAPGLDLGAPPAAPYRVLARKYRPSNFDDLIGQEPMVRTLANAFATGRIHQAYILTGVRGIGKTTTARILARAFNYEMPGKADAPTIDMPELGVHCQAIIESRHVDVIEMDAASHTGIDDIREIIDNARYRPVSARTKVYIIDEVHMLSKAAFNGLLKTLEEPPEHVKFLFATTEIDKVPITVRSRCQRFDLRRVEADLLVPHLGRICAAEGVTIHPEALSLIARAAEGSVRDSLSLLDQAIAHGTGAAIEEENVRAMLGLADRTRIIDLFEAVAKGEIAPALAILKAQYDIGADPAQVIADLAGFVHFITRLKLVPEAVKDPTITPEEARRGGEFAERLPIRLLSRLWQILLKGLQDVKDAPRPLAAADMVLVRITHAADLPPIDEIVQALQSTPGGGGSGVPGGAPSGGGARAALARAPMRAAEPQAARQAQAQPQAMAAGAPVLGSFNDLLALAESNRDIQMKIALERDVELVTFEPGRMEFSLAEGGSQLLTQQISRRIAEWTGQRWMVALSSRRGSPTIASQRARAEDGRRAAIHADPVVAKVMELFPGATVTQVRTPGAEEPPAPAADEPPAHDEDIGYADEDFNEDDL